MIKPTVGRVVLYHPSKEESISTNEDQPLAAIVVCVHGDRCVNLTVFDAAGYCWNRIGVTLVQPEDERPDGPYCEWMPYQKGQAAKTEALEQQSMAEVARELTAGSEIPSQQEVRGSQAGRKQS